jgi:hypothetical protein
MTTGKLCVMCGYIQPKGPRWYELQCPRCGADYPTGEVSTRLESTPRDAGATAPTENSAGKRRVLVVAILALVLAVLTILALAPLG